MNLLFVLMSDPLANQCFQANSQLVGYSNNLSFVLTLIPQVNLSPTYQSLNNNNQTYVNMVFNTTGSILKSSVVTLNLTAPTVVFVATVRNQSAFLTLQSETVSFYQMIAPIVLGNASVANFTINGTIQQLSSFQLNSIGCWANAALTYNMNYLNKTVNVSVTPQTCSIPPTVRVQLQYEYSPNNWKFVPIYPTPGLVNGFQSNTSYSQSNVKFFNQSFDTLLLPNESQAMNQLFQSLLDNRSLSLQLVIVCQINGIPTQFSAKITNPMGLNSSICYKNFQTYWNPTDILVLMDHNATCRTYNAQAAYYVFTINMASTKLYQASLNYRVSAANSLYLLDYPLSPAWTMNSSTMTGNIFQTTYDANGHILSDYTYYKSSRTACLQDITVKLYNNQICADSIIVQSTSCLSHYLNSSQKFLLLYDNPNVDNSSQIRTYFNFTVTFPPVVNYVSSFCVNDLNESSIYLANKVNGSFYDRIQQYIQSSMNLNKSQVQQVIGSANMNVFAQNLIVADVNNQLLYLILTIVAAATAVSIIIILLLRGIADPKAERV